LNGTITYTAPVKVIYNKMLMNSAIMIYPNPATNQINIAVNNAGQQVSRGYLFKIFNESGIQVLSATSTLGNWQGNVSNLSVGTYIVQVYANDQQLPVGKSKFVKH